MARNNVKLLSFGLVWTDTIKNQGFPFSGVQTVPSLSSCKVSCGGAGFDGMICACCAPPVTLSRHSERNETIHFNSQQNDAE